MKKRQANFEVLRVVAMAMIVAMHYLNRGNILEPLSENRTVVNSVAWLIESFCIVAANSYVLISGYFLVEAEWKLKKLWTIILQILFYSLMVPTVCFVFGIGTVREWTVYDWIIAVLPLQMDHYWFATAYVLLFALTPVLAAGVKALSKKQLRIVIAMLLLYFCFFKTIVPLQLSTDRFGYDYPWFICLFLIAAYIRLYGKEDRGMIIAKIHFFSSGKKSLLSYCLLTFVLFAFSLILGIVNAKVGFLQHYMNMVYSYNHILTFLSSLAFFFCFYYWEPKEGKFISFLCKIAPYSFGVYLLHENIAIRHIWMNLFGIEKIEGSFFFIPSLIVAVFLVMVIGMTMDFLRKKLFSMILK